MNRVFAAAVLAIAVLLSSCAKKVEAPTHPSDDVTSCFTFTSRVFPETATYRVAAINNCGRNFDQVFFLVKLMDTWGIRLGSDSFKAYYVQAGERIVHDFAIAPGLPFPVRFVALRKISTNPKDADK